MMTATATLSLVPRAAPAPRARVPATRGLWGGGGGSWRKKRIGQPTRVQGDGDAPTPPPKDNSDLEPEQRDYTGSRKQFDEPVSVPKKLPAMLFPAEEVLLPGSSQVLHLFEARF